jgi:hypothetical protein
VEFLDLLKPLYDSYLDTAGEVIIEGSTFYPSQILKELEAETYGIGFTDWWAARKAAMLKNAERILNMYDNRSRFERLKKAYIDGNIVPFVGAGLSIPSGYPGWTQFLRELRVESDVTEDDLEGLLSSGEYEEAAQRLYNDSPASFDESFINYFGQQRPIIGAVLYLSVLFSGSIITTNVDDVLKRVFEQLEQRFETEMFGDDADEFLAVQGNGNRILLLLHGQAGRAQHRVITKEEYDRVYNDPTIAERLIQEVLFHKPLLFMGCSLQYDRWQKEMSAFITSRTGARHQAPVKHFAFLETRSTDDRVARKKQLAKSNIFPIWYPEGEHDEAIESLLLKLAEDVIEL